MLTRDDLIKQKEKLELDKTALMASQVIADLNAINGGLQTIEFLLESFEEDAGG
jgi:hypothetical protein